MLKVEYIKGAASRGYLKIGIVCDGERASYTVSEATYRSVGEPRAADILTRDSLEAIKTGDMEYRAHIYALRILAYADNSERRLIEKLIGRGISRDIAERTASEMVSLGYINTSRQLDTLVRAEVNNRFAGPGKIIPKLRTRGYSSQDISEAITRLLDAGEIDFDEAKSRLIKSKGIDPDDEESVKKILYRNGHKI